MALDLAGALELPEGAASRYTLHNVWGTRADLDGRTLDAAESLDVNLAPFEVITMELNPLWDDSRTR